jgi:hypothetical protein
MDEVGVSDTRRSPRVLLRIPICLMVTEDQPEHGLTAVVNQHGALVLSPIQCEQGTVLLIRNELNGASSRCRVVWAGPADPSGAYKLGIEFTDEASTFWGSGYQEAISAGVQTAGVGTMSVRNHTMKKQ